jgi:hypothetical protein
MELWICQNPRCKAGFQLIADTFEDTKGTLEADI